MEVLKKVKRKITVLVEVLKKKMSTDTVSLRKMTLIADVQVQDMVSILLPQFFSVNITKTCL